MIFECIFNSNKIHTYDIPKDLPVKFVSSLNNSFKLINQYSNSKTSIYFGGSLYFIGNVLSVNNLK